MISLDFLFLKYKSHCLLLQSWVERKSLIWEKVSWWRDNPRQSLYVQTSLTPSNYFYVQIPISFVDTEIYSKDKNLKRSTSPLTWIFPFKSILIQFKQVIIFIRFFHSYKKIREKILPGKKNGGKSFQFIQFLWLFSFINVGSLMMDYDLMWQ